MCIDGEIVVCFFFYLFLIPWACGGGQSQCLTCQSQLHREKKKKRRRVNTLSFRLFLFFFVCKPMSSSSAEGMLSASSSSLSSVFRFCGKIEESHQKNPSFSFPFLFFLLVVTHLGLVLGRLVLLLGWRGRLLGGGLGRLLLLLFLLLLPLLAVVILLNVLVLLRLLVL